ncbi:MAG: hypothetical protein HRU46_03330 [Verrucomicrobiales bacterium]|nr:hypothetical protein [Verrucomicrobiales bacterium]
MARDLQVINVAESQITARMASIDKYVLPPDVTSAHQKRYGQTIRAPAISL